MRIPIAVLILVALPLAGCLEPESPVIVDSTPVVYDKDVVTQLPERRFEPTLEFEPDRYEMAKGTNVDFTFHVTDLDDYSLPMTFIDWVIVYDREPNPVAEGDATMLPGAYNRTLHAEDYHLFLFRADDGQGFLDRKVVIIEVGDPDEEPPSDEEVKLFIHEAEVIVGAADPLPEEEEPEEEPATESVTFEGSVAYPCEGGPGGSATVQEVEHGVGVGCTAEAEECIGWVQGINGLDCWWFPLEDPALWDQPFTTTGKDPDIWFYESCGHTNAEDDTVYLRPLVRPHLVGRSATSGLESGTIPVWTGCVVMYEFGGALGETSGGPLSLTIDSREQWDGDPWVNVDEAGVCHAESYWVIDQTTVSGETVPPTMLYEHDRTGSMYSRSPGFALWNTLWDGESGGTWVYQENNGIKGLQVGGYLPEPLGSELGGDTDYLDCMNPDLLLY